MGIAFRKWKLGTSVPKVESRKMDLLMAMGFPDYQCTKALAETGGNAEAAANFIMSNMDQPHEWWFLAPEPPAAPSSGKTYPADDAGEYASLLQPFLAKLRTP